VAGKYDLDAIRNKLKTQMQGRRSDPDEFKPAKAEANAEPIKYRFFILPPFDAGEMIRGGAAKHGMENQFFIQHANHWIDNKPYACPRVWDGTDCPFCSFGFDLLKDEKVKNDQGRRTKVVKDWMPNQQFMMNIYFMDSKVNPEDLRDRVMFFNAPKTVIDVCSACLMREESQIDPESPEAWGVFFDESAAYPFELQVFKKGQNNSYEKSKFLTSKYAIARDANHAPDQEKIKKILSLRHDLFAKIEMPDLKKLQSVFDLRVNGDDSGADKAAGGFDDDETFSGKKDAGDGKKQVAKTTTTKVETAPPATDVLDEERPLPKTQTQAAPAASTADDDVAALMSQLEED
jgi:hypothetical protein